MLLRAVEGLLAALVSLCSAVLCSLFYGQMCNSSC